MKGNLDFWRKGSDFAALSCLLLFILLSFFKTEIRNFSVPIYILGIISIIFFLLSEGMKFFIKRKKNDK